MWDHALEKLAEKLFGERIPGFQWVFFILVMLGLPLGIEGFCGSATAIGLALFFFWAGGILDIVFDLFYGPVSTFTIRVPDWSDPVLRNRPPRGATGKILTDRDWGDPLRDNFCLVVDGEFGDEGAFVTAKKFTKERHQRGWLRHLIDFCRGRLSDHCRNIPLFGREALDGAREKAAERFREYRFNIETGLYESCLLLLRSTKAWSARVNPPLQVSKVARALVLLFASISLFQYLDFDWLHWLRGGTEHRVHSAFRTEHDMLPADIQWLWVRAEAIIGSLHSALPQWSLVAATALMAFICLIISFAYRIQHMRNLYLEAADAHWLDPSTIPLLRATATGSLLTSARSSAASGAFLLP